MEIIAWILYGLFYVGPYILGLIIFFFAIITIQKLAFRKGRRLGYVVLVLISIGLSWMAYKYLLLAPSSFESACSSGTGLKTYKQIHADSYVLNYAPNHGGGYLHGTDATIESAILSVALKKVQFVELQDSQDPSYAAGVHSARLARYRTELPSPGYFHVFTARRGSAQCAWLMPVDVKPLLYDIYLSYEMNHELNKKLLSEDGSVECIAVKYVQHPSAVYVIDFSVAEKINDNLVKHSIRALDRSSNNAVIGEMVAYEHKADSVYSSLAFWLANGKRHPRCPLNLLEGNVVHSLLNLKAIANPSFQGTLRDDAALRP